jgi:hypothetical protein
MATEKQIQVNRINALKAGVKTEAACPLTFTRQGGKAVSRMNALSHGFYSSSPISTLYQLSLNTLKT